jgi:hypothetical protein
MHVYLQINTIEARSWTIFLLGGVLAHEGDDSLHRKKQWKIYHMAAHGRSTTWLHMEDLPHGCTWKIYHMAAQWYIPTSVMWCEL